LRVILSTLYTVVETVRVPVNESNKEQYEELAATFKAELSK